MKQFNKYYSDLLGLTTFEERFNYLKLYGKVGSDTFGFDRYLNQIFYNSYEWRRVRDEVIRRDNGCDLGIKGYEIFGKIIIHHMNPITIDDINDRNPDIFNPEYLITTTLKTHNALHYGNEKNGIPKGLIERKPGDTCPWKH